MSICSKKEALPFENGREFLCFLLAEQILFVSVQHCPRGRFFFVFLYFFATTMG